MEPIEFEEQTNVLGRPPNVSPEDCRGLPVMILPGDAKMGARFFSYWKPSPEELKVLIEGGQVRLCIRGVAHPPVWIDTAIMKEKTNV